MRDGEGLGEGGGWFSAYLCSNSNPSGIEGWPGRRQSCAGKRCQQPLQAPAAANAGRQPRPTPIHRGCCCRWAVIMYLKKLLTVYIKNGFCSAYTYSGTVLLPTLNRFLSVQLEPDEVLKGGFRGHQAPDRCSEISARVGFLDIQRLVYRYIHFDNGENLGQSGFILRHSAPALVIKALLQRVHERETWSGAAAATH